MQFVRSMLLVATFASLAPTSAHAGPIWDWLTGKNKKQCPPQGCAQAYPCGAYPAPVNPYYTPPATRVGYAPLGYANYLPETVPAQYLGYGAAPAYGALPTTAYYAPAYATQATYSAPAYAVNTLAGPQPVVTGYAPAVGSCPTCGNQTRYVPQPAYRGTVNRVPVTAYRPVSSFDPATGAPIVVMKPCTAYECQVQQVRSGLAYGAPATCAGPNCPGATYAAGTCPPGYTTAPVPTYTAPAPVITTPAPSGIVTPPGTTIIPGGARPATTVPGGAFQPSTEPADARPNLAPEGLKSGASAPPVSPQRWNSSGDGLLPVNAKPAVTPTVDPRLQPVPDPEAPRHNSAPQLINPRDKLTLTDPLRPYKVATVVYPEAPVQNPAVGPVQRIPSIDRYDDSGWRAAASRP